MSDVPQATPGHSRPASARGRPPWLVLALAAIGVLAVVAVVLASRSATPSPPARPASPPAAGSSASGASRSPVAVTVATAAAGRVVPRSFLGLSTEYWTVPVWARHLSLLGRVLATITPDGPLILRIGGSSADQTRWAPARELPEWVFETTPAWLHQVRAMINRFGAKVILDLNLITSNPAIAVRWARAAEAALPSESIIGFEIGNEADIYSPAAWRRTTGGARGVILPARITARDYARAYRDYAGPLLRMDPHVPLFGPALSDPAAHLSWITTLLGGPHPGLRAVTVHRYPLSACSRPGARTFPTIARVLSEQSSSVMAHTLTGTLRAARRAHLPVRLTEINSVTCGGRRGVSDTFATALWAPDAMFELLKAGVSSAAVHVRADAINMAFSLTAHGLVANPLVYGLATFARTLGPSPRLLPVTLRSARRLALKAWAVRSGARTVHVLLINKGGRPASVALRLPTATGAAQIQRLLAPTARSRSGVTLAGQHLDAGGRWVGSLSTHTASPTPAGYPVFVPATSAALVTVQLATTAGKPGRRH
ncbi:MAG TPA: glycosyl hydrolase family 79 C-terminal domain-containing protein [Solirubrobacteraceae bacterium]|nr:glycosyl hydrolase family 79 C-terminal domain-containing protein [Solirubrobacteraceae bacterium]